MCDTDVYLRCVPKVCDPRVFPPQVLSGGGVLQLSRGQKVWMEGFIDNQPASVTDNTLEKKIIFNGFLVFPTS